ncbi:hypothetical protein K435DRAFT_740600 [Dendrothele bispora CBS 962.96]|uniref:Arrestin C-terminal-like domain-containing protein n=1 Tax=Dendrothele bispora (strain CBS 962.96) TaxID=1314807 RepID=A0A4S8MYG0_DENBC|nr:hypothetical protein K435DRAFT_740600 [Dendrothele bispora CBS 962.96]
MSQVKLTLRPPPNVDFVHGYPGIPPGAPDRPQAAVKGAVEVRTGPQGVKAKWVRVELRKIETLPGGGISNTFSDFVGPSPVTVWTASEEYAVLRSHDFQFSIRIPESVPPSIALENRAGIKYELHASVCTKGKRGFLRRRKSTVTSTHNAIIIDKHELHSTWPIYCQPETRNISNEGVTLTVERNHTCYGPGDKITVIASLKSDSLHTILLRGFELTLKESTIFRAGPYVSGKKSVPQVKVAVISESKLPVNFNLYGGMVQRAELTCAISPNHTTTTLNTARHIDITYVLSVKAQLSAGAPIVIDLPVILSNWQRNVSNEAIRRIGAAPSLSLVPGNTAQPPSTSMHIEPAPGRGTSRPSETQTFGGVGSQPDYSRPTTANNTFAASSRLDNSSRVDEFGSKLTKATSIDDFTTKSSSTDAVRRPGSAGTSATNNASKFTVANAQSSEVPRGGHGRRPSAGASGNTSTTANRAWPSAEEEKQMLYERAKAQVEKVQGAAAAAVAQSTPTATTPPANGSSRNWLSAEEEKMRLFNSAQDAVKRAQGQNVYSPQSQVAKPTSSAGGSFRADAGFKPVSSAPHYPSAEEEKAALKRYQEAKVAVERTQNAGFGSSSSVSPANNDLPPPFEAAAPVPVDAPVDARTALAEKERLRRAYEAQDAAAAATTASANQDTYTDAPAYSSPPPFHGGSSSIQNAISEKEMLRRKFEQQDAEALAAAAASRSTPPRKTPSPVQSRARPTPPPPVAGGSRVRTAAEEKAMLRAKYEAEESGSSTPPPHVNGYSNGISEMNGINGTNGYSSPMSSAPPPPLMPRPPAEYIQETQEEDARVSRYVNGSPLLDDVSMPPLPSPSAPVSRSNSGKLDVRPFTPFSSGFDNPVLHMPGAPPLPPKPPGE